MAQKLKKLEITSVDLVERGANQDAYIKFYKSKEKGARMNLSEKIARAVAKALGTLSDDYMEPAEYIEKTGDEMRMSIDSILEDEGLSGEEKGAMIQKSFDEYCEELAKSARNWKRPGRDADLDEYEDDDPEDRFEDEADEEDRIDKKCKTKKSAGGCDMNFNTEKMSPKDKALFEKLVNQYGDAPEPDGGQKKEDPKKKKELDPETEDLKKSLEDGLAEVEAIKKQVQLTEMVSIAKKYEPLGYKPDALAEKLMNFKAADEDIYKTYIKALDETLEMQDASGIFKEFGTSRGSDGNKVEEIAKAFIEKTPDITREQAIMKAFEEHPELAAEYDKEYFGGK